MSNLAAIAKALKKIGPKKTFFVTLDKYTKYHYRTEATDKDDAEELAKTAVDNGNATIDDEGIENLHIEVQT